MTDLLSQKNTEGVNFQPKKIRRTSPSCILQVPPLGNTPAYFGHLARKQTFS